MPKIHIILGSTRPGRAGEKIAQWVYETLSERHDADYELVDLADYNLPLLDEPAHPIMQQYEHEHTKRWAAKVAEADGFVIVTPEYNHGYPAALKNALDYLNKEWNGKPVAFVSYGGISGGLRAVEQLRQVVVELRMIPVRDQVSIAWIAFENGQPQDPRVAASLEVMATDLLAHLPAMATA